MIYLVSCELASLGHKKMHLTLSFLCFSLIYKEASGLGKNSHHQKGEKSISAKPPTPHLFLFKSSSNDFHSFLS